MNKHEENCYINFLENKIQRLESQLKIAKGIMENVASVTKNCCDEQGAEYWVEKSAVECGEALKKIEEIVNE